jgi:hypothetical protein
MSEQTGPPRERKLLIYAVIVFIVLLAAMFGWKELSLFRFERSIQVEREAERAHLAEQESRIRDAAVARVSEMIELFSMPLAWAVRSEAVQDDYGQIEEYMLQLIKRPSIRVVAYVGSDGNVQMATDRKIQGEPAQALYGDLTAGEEVELRSVENDLRLMVPVLGYNERLGSFVVVFDRAMLLTLP